MYSGFDELDPEWNVGMVWRTDDRAGDPDLSPISCGDEVVEVLEIRNLSLVRDLLASKT